MTSSHPIFNNLLLQEPSKKSTGDSDEKTAANEGDTTQPEPSQTSPSEISKCPAELLGLIFEWSAALVDPDRPLDYNAPSGSLQKRPYNFLYVCHHWTNVAYGNPNLWTTWGPGLKGWERNIQCDRAPKLPIDLVFLKGEHFQVELSTALRDTLKDRAARDMIREIHLGGWDTNLLDSILSALTPDGEGVRGKCIESIILHSPEKNLKEIPNFFAQLYLPRLRCLKITTGSLEVPVWKHIVSGTTRLTCLSLKLDSTTYFPTTLQLTSVLTANPKPQELVLSGALPEKAENLGDTRIPLDHLRKIELTGNFYSTVGLFNILRLPTTLDYMLLDTGDPGLRGIGPLLQSHMEDLFRNDPRFSKTLEVSSSLVEFTLSRVTVAPYNSLEKERPKKIFDFHINYCHPHDPRRFIIHLMRFIPGERVRYVEMDYIQDISNEPFIATPNLETLVLNNVKLRGGRFLQVYPDGAHAGRKFLPLLKSLSLNDVKLKKGGTWQPLRNYIKEQSSGGQSMSLKVRLDSMCKLSNAVKKKMIRYFKSLGVEAEFSGSRSYPPRLSS